MPDPHDPPCPDAALASTTEAVRALLRGRVEAPTCDGLARAPERVLNLIRHKVTF